MGGHAEHWMDHLEIQGEASAVFFDFENIFIDQYMPLDNKNIARDKL